MSVTQDTDTAEESLYHFESYARHSCEADLFFILQGRPDEKVGTTHVTDCPQCERMHNFKLTDIQRL